MVPEFLSVFAYLPLCFSLVHFKTVVKKRIDRTQSRLDKVTNQELLLEAAHALRIVKDRQKELEGQLEQQIKDIHRCETVLWSIVYSFILHLI